MARKLSRHAPPHRTGFAGRRTCFARGIQREKRIKHWSRKQKLTLIESTNPGWDDLYDTLN